MKNSTECTKIVQQHNCNESIFDFISFIFCRACLSVFVLVKKTIVALLSLEGEIWNGEVPNMDSKIGLWN